MKRKHRAILPLAIGAVLLFTGGANASAVESTSVVESSASSSSPQSSPSPEAFGLRQPRAGLFTGGPPQADAWPKIAASGVSTVIDLRMPAEKGEGAEAEQVRALGMAYEELPIAGAAAITDENAARLWQLVSRAEGPVVLHCASGNRVGALLSIGAWRQGGMSPRQALEFGKAAGLGSLEPRVRELLQLPPAD